MTIQPNDLLLVQRGTNSYKLAYQDKAKLQPNDLLLVQRGTALHKVAYKDIAKCQPTDLFLVQRASALYKCPFSLLGLGSATGATGSATGATGSATGVFWLEQKAFSGGFVGSAWQIYTGLEASKLSSLKVGAALITPANVYKVVNLHGKVGWEVFSRLADHLTPAEKTALTANPIAWLKGEGIKNDGFIIYSTNGKDAGQKLTDLSLGADGHSMSVASALGVYYCNGGQSWYTFPVTSIPLHGLNAPLQESFGNAFYLGVDPADNSFVFEIEEVTKTPPPGYPASSYARHHYYFKLIPGTFKWVALAAPPAFLAHKATAVISNIFDYALPGWVLPSYGLAFDNHFQIKPSNQGFSVSSASSGTFFSTTFTGSVTYIVFFQYEGHPSADGDQLWLIASTANAKELGLPTGYNGNILYLLKKGLNGAADTCQVIDPGPSIPAAERQPNDGYGVHRVCVTEDKIYIQVDHYLQNIYTHRLDTTAKERFVMVSSDNGATWSFLKKGRDDSGLLVIGDALVWGDEYTLDLKTWITTPDGAAANDEQNDLEGVRNSARFNTNGLAVFSRLANVVSSESGMVELEMFDKAGAQALVAKHGTKVETWMGLSGTVVESALDVVEPEVVHLSSWSAPSSDFTSYYYDVIKDSAKTYPSLDLSAGSHDVAHGLKAAASAVTLYPHPPLVATSKFSAKTVTEFSIQDAGGAIAAVDTASKSANRQDLLLIEIELNGSETYRAVAPVNIAPKDKFINFVKVK